MIELYNEDCLEVMKNIEDKSIDSIITDPPYYKIRGEFDFIWKTFDDYLKFIEILATEFKRILKTNGSLIWFGDDKNISYCQIIFDKHFDFLNHLVWNKNTPISKGESNYKMFPTRTERALFYECKKANKKEDGFVKNHDNPLLFREIKDYFLEELEKFRIKKGLKTKKQAEKEIDKIIGTSRMAYHYFGDYQWLFPTEDKYKKIQNGTNELKKDYEILKKDYEILKRPFNYSKNLNEILTYYPVFSNRLHITQKPEKLMDKIIATISRENNLILDPFMGSGTTGASCVNLSRNFIGIEKDKEYFEIAKKRIKQAEKQPKLI